MRHKNFLALLAFLLLISFASIVQAQPSVTWLAWTYDQLNGEMIQFDSTGFTRKSVILPKPRGYESYDYTYQVVVSPSGDRVAYTLNNPVNGEIVMTVYHLVRDFTMMTYSLPVMPNTWVEHSLNYSPTSHTFSGDGRYLAFSYFIEGNWTMMVMDTETNGVSVQNISNTSPMMPPSNDTFSFAVPIYFESNIINFVIAPIGGDGYFVMPHYAWDFIANSVRQVNNYPTVQISIEPRTREVIYTTLDNRFRDRTDAIMGMGVHLNSVQVYSPSVKNSAFPFYVDENNIIESAIFIQNGELILLRVSEIDGDSYGVPVVIDRNGNRRGILPHERLWMTNSIGVGDGLVFSAFTDELEILFPTLRGQDSTALIYVQTTSGIDGNVGQVIHVGTRGTTARLVWAQDITGLQAPNPNTWVEVPAVALGNPPVLPPVSNPPVQNPTSNSGLYVGAQARVTLEGDGLNMRQSPTTGANRVAQLPALTIVNVLGGSQFADGFTWWQVGDGIVTGWVAEGNGGVLWLEIYTGTMPPPADNVPAGNQPAGALSAPIILSPISDIAVSDGAPPIQFAWQPVAGANQYVLEIQTCAATCEWVSAFYTVQPSYSWDVTQYPVGYYRWRIVPLDAQGNSGTPTDWRHIYYAN